MLDDIEFDDGFAMVTGEASPMPRSRTPKEPDKGRVRRQTVRDVARAVEKIVQAAAAPSWMVTV